MNTSNGKATDDSDRSYEDLRYDVWDFIFHRVLCHEPTDGRHIDDEYAAHVFEPELELICGLNATSPQPDDFEQWKLAHLAMDAVLQLGPLHYDSFRGQRIHTLDDLPDEPGGNRIAEAIRMHVLIRRHGQWNLGDGGDSADVRAARDLHLIGWVGIVEDSNGVTAVCLRGGVR